MDAFLQSENTELQGKFLIFSICGTDYGIDIAHVTEIIGMQHMTLIPRAPAYVRGITNIRGAIVPVVDMRLRFGFSEAVCDEKTCIVLVSSGSMQAGLIVDAVEDVISLLSENILPLPQENLAEKNKFLKAIGKDGEYIKQIIDIDKILEGKTAEVL